MENLCAATQVGESYAHRGHGRTLGRRYLDGKQNTMLIQPGRAGFALLAAGLIFGVGGDRLARADTPSSPLLQCQEGWCEPSSPDGNPTLLPSILPTLSADHGR